MLYVGPPMQAEQLTIEVPGLRLAAQAWGPPDGTPALALHGWLDNSNSYARLAPLLEGLRIVALDLPGHGQSDHRPPGVGYHFVDWTVDAAAAAEALGWERYALLGHSMGAGIASLLAGTLPERITRLVLIEGLGPLSCAVEDAPARLRNSIVRQRKREQKRARAHADRAAAVERLRLANPAIGPESAELIVARGTRQTDEGVVWSSDPRLRGFSPLRVTEEHVRCFLGQIACPTLLIRGREGFPFDPQGIGARVECVPQLEVVELPGEHHLHMDRAEAVAEVVRPFLAPPEPSPWKGAPKLPRRVGVDLAALATLKSLKLVVLDVDGVLTPGAQVPYGPAGNELLTFSIRDGMGIKLLQRAGIEVALLSGRDTSPTRARAKDLGITHLHLGVEQKVPRLEQLAEELGVPLSEVAYMGDDINDLPPLRAVGFAAAPRDAHPEVLKIASWIAQAGGGRGAVRELAEQVLKFQGKWEQALAYYEGGASG